MMSWTSCIPSTDRPYTLRPTWQSPTHVSLARTSAGSSHATSTRWLSMVTSSGSTNRACPALRRRLRADPIAVHSVHAAAVREDMPVQAAAPILSLLAAASPAGVSVLEAINDCLNRVADEPFATLTRDIVLGATVSVQTTLLNAASAVR